MKAWLKKYDIVTRIVALLGALILWFFVIQVVDPKTTKTVTLPVLLDNMDVLEGRGLVMTSTKTLQVEVTFTGNVNIITEIIKNPEQYGRLRLNLANYSTAYRGSASAGWVWNSGQPSTVDNVYVTPVSIIIESVQKQLVPVELHLTGKAPEGYAAEAMYPDPAHITVIGPDSLVSGIATAAVTYDISNVRENVRTDRPIDFLDADGNVLSLNHELVTIEQQTVVIQITVTRSKMVNLKNRDYLNYPGFLPPDAIVTQISPSSVEVSGEPDEVEKVNSIELGDIDIMAFLMSDELYGQGFVEREINVPNGVKSDMNGQVATVYITFPGYVRQRLELSTDDLPDNPFAEYFDYEGQSLSLMVFGPGSEPDGVLFDPNSLTVVLGVDPTELEPGEQDVPVTFLCAEEGVQVLGGYTLRIDVPEPFEGEETTNPDGSVIEDGETSGTEGDNG